MAAIQRNVLSFLNTHATGTSLVLGGYNAVTALAVSFEGLTATHPVNAREYTFDVIAHSTAAAAFFAKLFLQRNPNCLPSAVVTGLMAGATLINEVRLGIAAFNAIRDVKPLPTADAYFGTSTIPTAANKVDVLNHIANKLGLKALGIK